VTPHLCRCPKRSVATFSTFSTVAILVLAAASGRPAWGADKPVRFAKIGAQVSPPPGWATDPALSTTVLAEFDKSARLPGLGPERILTGGGSWVNPGGGGALHVFWMVSNGAPTEVAQVVRRELDAVPARFSAGASKAGGLEVVSWKEEIGDSQAEGRLEGKNAALGTRSYVRLIAWLDAKQNWRELRVECVAAADDQLAARRDLCAAALASASITAPPADRSPLGQVPPMGTGVGESGGVLAQFGSSGAGAGGDAGATSGPGSAQLVAPTPGASLGPGGTGPLRIQPEAPLRTSKPPGQDRASSRALLIGGGLLVIIALAWTMGRKYRAK
jgi:hypothetical protein